MILKYKVTIDGQDFEVEVAEGAENGEFVIKAGDKEFTATVEGTAAPRRRLSTKATPTGAPVPQPTNHVGVDATAQPPPGGGTVVEAPMAGRVTRIYVKTGAKVKQGQLLLILEAMKMENEIVSPCDGKVMEVYAQEGGSVSHSAPMCRIE